MTCVDQVRSAEDPARASREQAAREAAIWPGVPRRGVCPLGEIARQEDDLTTLAAHRAGLSVAFGNLWTRREPEARAGTRLQSRAEGGTGGTCRCLD